MSSHIRQAAGSLFSPALLLMARMGKSSNLAAKAIAADPENIAAQNYAMRLARADNAVFQRFLTATRIAGTLSPNSADLMQRHFSISRSQILQDLVCLLVHNEKRDGYFVEVGVGNGVDISNTYMLEEAFGWGGLLVEPNRSSHDNIRANRKARLDTRAAGLSDQTHVRFSEHVEGEFSSLDETQAQARGGNVITYDVEIAPLSQILEEAQAPRSIDFLSLDTEGNEIAILESLDLGAWEFGFMAIEHNFNKEKIAQLDAMLTPHGYRRVLMNHSAFDAWYVHERILSGPDSDPRLA